MKKSFTLFSKFALLPLFALLAISCIFEGEDDPETRILSIEIDSPKIAKQPEFSEQGGSELVFYVVPETTSEDMKHFIPKIKVSPGCIVTPNPAEKHDFSEGPATYTVKHSNTGLNSQFTLRAIRNKYEGTEMTSISIDYDKIVKAPKIPTEGTEIHFVVSADATQEELSALAPTFELSPGATSEPVSGSVQDFTKGAVEYTVFSEVSKEKKTVYTVICTRELYEDAQMLSISIEDPKGIIIEQPVFESGKLDYVFYVNTYATKEDMATLVPSITLSAGATLSEDSPALGEAPGFEEDKVIKYTVKSEDGDKTTDYTIVCTKKKVVYDFEDWVVEFKDSEVDFYAPGPTGHWGTSNNGSMMASGIAGIKETADRLVVMKTNDAHRGNTAALLRTIDTKTGSVIMQRMVPRVTSGSLFLGIFDLNYGDQLLSTKFGIPFEGKPLKLTGQIKYKSGPEYYEVKPGDRKGNPTLIPDKKDEGIVGVIIYEIDSDDAVYVSGKNTYTDERIIGKAQYILGDTDGYQPFSIEIDYSKEYDKSKKYRLSVIASSSVNGAGFHGAPFSELHIDDVAIYYEE